MAEQKPATQLPLFRDEDKKFFRNDADEAPASWLDMPEESVAAKVLNLQDCHIDLLAPYMHREIRMQREVDHEDKMAILARKAGLALDDVELARAAFCDGKLQPELFELFVEAFERALLQNDMQRWLKRVGLNSVKPKAQKVRSLRDRRSAHGS